MTEEDRGQKSEVGGQMSEVIRPKTEVVGQTCELCACWRRHVAAIRVLESQAAVADDNARGYEMVGNKVSAEIHKKLRDELLESSAVLRMEAKR